MGGVTKSADESLLAEQDLAATPQDSRERFEARRLLPGMAKRIREVGTRVDSHALSRCYFGILHVQNSHATPGTRMLGRSDSMC